MFPTGVTLLLETGRAGNIPHKRKHFGRITMSANIAQRARTLSKAREINALDIECLLSGLTPASERTQKTCAAAYNALAKARGRVRSQLKKTPKGSSDLDDVTRDFIGAYTHRRAILQPLGVTLPELLLEVLAL